MSSFLAQESQRAAQPTVPVRQCELLVSTPAVKALLGSSAAKTLVDYVVKKDPYYEYERAVNAPIIWLVNILLIREPPVATNPDERPEQWRQISQPHTENPPGFQIPGDGWMERLAQ